MLLCMLVVVFKVILFDELFSKFDFEICLYMRVWVFNKLKEGGIFILMVIYDSDDVVVVGG